jgi:acyl-CoA reductase-like NAD-dependent aldehyde dehydrogenase
MYHAIFKEYATPQSLSAVEMPLIHGVTPADLRGTPRTRRHSWSDCALPDLVETSAREVATAVEAAAACFKIGSWSKLTKVERKNVATQWAQLLQAHAHELATLCCVDTGRAYRNFEQDSIPKAIECLRWFIESYDKLEDKLLTGALDHTLYCAVKREAIGVVAAILPWNDPLVTLVWKVAPALLLGNSLVIKPSEHASLAIVRSVQLAHLAGVPLAALQVATGGALTGTYLAAHPDVQAIAFTGSTATALKIGQASLQTGLKKLSFECGGKSPFIIDRNTTDLNVVANVVAKNMFYNQGQICSAPSRVYVHEQHFDHFSRLLHEASKLYIPAHPLADTPVGFMVSQAATQRVRDLVERACVDGVERISACTDDELAHPEWSVTPTILCNVDDSHAELSAEIFGPVLNLHTYDSHEEVIARANGSKFGLAAGIWSDDLNAALLLAEQLQAGVVHINSYGDDENQMPFGGIKNSGTGKEKSVESFDSYSYFKSINIKLQRAQ